ncbi:MAG: carboxypeptidase-like regulatory domain-containing protein, partial [Methanomassiliicoccaceae archaeon]|jgi:hypothetical protein|nr:carboxypeptidase-like regulatory domain-containing protein [Methanomassiliicoccaceae archaeon]
MPLTGAVITYDVTYIGGGHISGLTATVDQSGIYTIKVPSGTHVSIKSVERLGYLVTPIGSFPDDPMDLHMNFNIVQDFDMYHDMDLEPYVEGKVTGPLGGMEGVTITYVMDDDGYTFEHTILTDADGRYRIGVKIGVTVIIRSVEKYGYILDDNEWIGFEFFMEYDDHKDVDFTMRYDPGVEYYVTGTVWHDSISPGGMNGVRITYDVMYADGSIATGLRTYTGNGGIYTITVPNGATVKITDVYRYGFALSDPADVPISLLMVKDHEDIDFTLVHDEDDDPATGEPYLFTISGRVWHDSISPGGLEDVTVTYTYVLYGELSSTPGTVQTSVDGAYMIAVPSGSTVTIINVVKYGFTLVQHPDHPAFPGDPIVIHMDRSVTLDFDMEHDGGSGGDPPAFDINGTVWHDSAAPGPGGMKDVTITYTVEYKGNVTQETTSTGDDGKYTIRVPSGSTVTITGVTKYGFVVAPHPDHPAFPGDPIVVHMDRNATLDFEMEHHKGSGSGDAETFSISGIVTYNGDPLSGAAISYKTEHTGSTTSGTAVTDTNGEYTITVPSGSNVSIMNTERYGYTVVPFDGFPTDPLTFHMDADAAQDFEMVLSLDPWYTVTVTSEEGRKFSYTLRYNGRVVEEGSFMIDDKGTWEKEVLDGTDIEIAAATRGTVTWAVAIEGIELPILRTTGSVYRVTVTESLDLTAIFSDEDKEYWWILLVLIGATIFFVLWCREGPAIFGTVTVNGKGIGNAVISYTVNGKAKKPVRAESNGRYEIPVSKRSTVVIKVSADGYAVNEQEVTTEVRHKRTKVDFTAAKSNK